MEISYPHEVINKQYLTTMKEFQECLNIEFDKLKRHHSSFDSFINSPSVNNVCKSQREELINLINGGILDYGKFDKK
jgi:hypothetical protein